MASPRRGRSPVRGAVSAPARPSPRRRALAFGAALVGVALLAPVAVAALPSSRVLLGGDDAASTAAGSSLSGDTDGRPWAATPGERTGLAFLRLDDPLERAVSTLGAPHRREPDMNGSFTHTWRLAPGGELDVAADEQGITGLAARVPLDPPVRIAAHGGVVIGESTPAEITDRWGDGHDVPSHEGEDFVLRYVECAGPFPVVVKFDQPGTAPQVRWDEPVTSVLIAYADAEPGTAGCPAP